MHIITAHELAIQLVSVLLVCCLQSPCLQIADSDVAITYSDPAAVITSICAQNMYLRI